MSPCSGRRRVACPQPQLSHTTAGSRNRINAAPDFVKPAGVVLRVDMGPIGCTGGELDDNSESAVLTVMQGQ